MYLVPFSLSLMQRRVSLEEFSDMPFGVSIDERILAGYIKPLFLYVVWSNRLYPS